jgi:hypothetical protein
LTDVFSNDAAKLALEETSATTADAGKTPTVVVLATSPPNVDWVASPRSTTPVSYEIARVYYAS